MMRLCARLPITWLVSEHVVSVYDVVGPNKFQQVKHIRLGYGTVTLIVNDHIHLDLVFRVPILVNVGRVDL